MLITIIEAEITNFNTKDNWTNFIILESKGYNLHAGDMIKIKKIEYSNIPCEIQGD